MREVVAHLRVAIVSALITRVQAKVRESCTQKNRAKHAENVNVHLSCTVYQSTTCPIESMAFVIWQITITYDFAYKYKYKYK